jgi:hypothetical protein
VDKQGKLAVPICSSQTKMYISKEMIIKAAKQDAKSLTKDARDEPVNTSTTQV